VPLTFHRFIASRLRRLPVLAVGAHPWIGSGEPLKGAVQYLGFVPRRYGDCGPKSEPISFREFTLSLAVPGAVLRSKASRLRRLSVLAVGAHRWIGSGEAIEAGRALARDSPPCEDFGWGLGDFRDASRAQGTGTTRLFPGAGFSWHPFRMRGILASHPVVSLRSTTGLWLGYLRHPHLELGTWNLR
jgi:hypothetical protein